jgi:hypothetical protein
MTESDRPRGTGSDLRGDVAAAAGWSAATSDRKAGREADRVKAAFGSYGAGRAGTLLKVDLDRAHALAAHALESRFRRDIAQHAAILSHPTRQKQ